jgi:hypothetical protein
MKLLSRLFRNAPAPPPPAAAAPPPIEAVAAVDPTEHERVLRTIASGSMEPSELARVAVEGQTTRVRQAAAAAINDPALWQDLLPRLRGRDKAAYKLIKQRTDALLAERRNVEQAALEADALCASIEKHSTRAHDALYGATLSLLTERWQALPVTPDAGVRQRAQNALERCRANTAAHDLEVARLAALREADEARARAVEAELLAQHEAAARRAAEQAAAEASAQAAAEQARAADARALADQRAAKTEAQVEIVSLIRLSGAALHRGDTRKAARFRQSIEAALPGAPSLPPRLTRSLEQLDARLNELRQWKDYVVAPKRIELIEEVEALIGVDEEPEALAEHLRALRQEWRTINQGIAVDVPTETERFERAYQAAFEPCRAYFAAQAAIRRANLDSRKQVLERVLAFEAAIDAEQPDHPRIARVLREAPQDWRRHAPVDRDANRPVEAEYYRALDRLRARVTAWHAHNAAEKQALIGRAQQLATAGDAPLAVDEVKRLQTQWKTTGPVPHAQSEALWEEFRALCNAVYERRQQAFAEQSAALELAKVQAVALCGQVEQASQQEPADRQSGQAQLREWQAAFAAIGELPRAEARGLQERFRRAMSRYEALLAGLEQRAAEAVETNVLAAARHVRAYQRAVIACATDAERAALRTAADAFIAGVPRWPNKGTLQALRQALARTDSAEFGTVDDAARELALRTLCVHAEILSAAATPPEDAGLRREHELQLLRQGLGQARRVDDRDWEAMRLEWLGIGAVAPEVHDELERRFVQCLARRWSRGQAKRSG